MVTLVTILLCIQSGPACVANNKQNNSCQLAHDSLQNKQTMQRVGVLQPSICFSLVANGANWHMLQHTDDNHSSPNCTLHMYCNHSHDYSIGMAESRMGCHQIHVTLPVIMWYAIWTGSYEAVVPLQCNHLSKVHSVGGQKMPQVHMFNQMRQVPQCSAYLTDWGQQSNFLSNSRGISCAVLFDRQCRRAVDKNSDFETSQLFKTKWCGLPEGFLCYS